MFKKLVLATALSLVLTNVACAEDKAPAKSASEMGIAVVNIPLIMSELPQAKEAEAALSKEFGPRQAELEKIRKQGMDLEAQLKNAKDGKVTEIQRKLASLKADFELKGQALQEDSQKKQHDAQVQLNRVIQEAINRIAKEKGLQLVIQGGAVVYASEAVDISQEVIERASKLKPKAKDQK